ncbi:hypothetical protein [Roseateles chitosanitabidus]|uniref:hypothetical protein n=1 Tax=Roseateles chitosanitabidus TaxID=65048 RepID=UPI001471A326|nr:hypothetical protein [Roseateles chitosanitabidus]
MQEPKSLIQVRVPKPLYDAVKAQAALQDRSVNWLINRILERAVASLDEPQLKGAEQ